MYHCVTHSIVDWQWLAGAFLIGVLVTVIVGGIISILADGQH